jgi:KDO2-lipid IV(A) lauroyltransferase
MPEPAADRFPVGLLFRAFSTLPLPAAHAIGTLLGWLAYRLPNRNRSVTLRNLELCLPELSPADRRRLARRSLIETGKTLAETPLAWCAAPERVLALIREVHGAEAIRQAIAEGRGVIIAGPHLGAWEVGGLQIGADFRPVSILYRPPRNATLDRLIHASRERTGAELVPTDAQGVRALLRRLARGGAVVILPDQDPGATGGVFAPFFGIRTNTMSLLTRLAAKSGALVVVGYAERLSRSRGFHIRYLPVEDPAIYSSDPQQAAAALNRAVEAAVRALPGQYQWSYKRFRRRPEGDAGLY